MEQLLKQNPSWRDPLMQALDPSGKERQNTCNDLFKHVVNAYDAFGELRDKQGSQQMLSLLVPNMSFSEIQQSISITEHQFKNASKISRENFPGYQPGPPGHNGDHRLQDCQLEFLASFFKQESILQPLAALKKYYSQKQYHALIFNPNETFRRYEEFHDSYKPKIVDSHSSPDSQRMTEIGKKLSKSFVTKFCKRYKQVKAEDCVCEQCLKYLWKLFEEIFPNILMEITHLWEAHSVLNDINSTSFLDWPALHAMLSPRVEKCFQKYQSEGEVLYIYIFSFQLYPWIPF